MLHIVVEEIASHRVEPGVDAPVFDAGDDRRGELIIEARFESLEVRCRSVDRDQAVSQSEPAVADGVKRGGYPRSFISYALMSCSASGFSSHVAIVTMSFAFGIL